MYLVAQHVRKPVDGIEGVNAFAYVHGPHAWVGFPPEGIPDEDPGELVHQQIEVLPPGNRVRAYLDIVALDEANWPEIQNSFVAFLSAAHRKQLPWEEIAGRCLFRIGLDLGLSKQWKSEVARLFRAARAVYLNIKPDQDAS